MIAANVATHSKSTSPKTTLCTSLYSNIEDKDKVRI